MVAWIPFPPTTDPHTGAVRKKVVGPEFRLNINIYPTSKLAAAAASRRSPKKHAVARDASGGIAWPTMSAVVDTGAQVSLIPKHEFNLVCAATAGGTHSQFPFQFLDTVNIANASKQLFLTNAKVYSAWVTIDEGPLANKPTPFFVPICPWDEDHAILAATPWRPRKSLLVPNAARSGGRSTRRP